MQAPSQPYLIPSADRRRSTSVRRGDGQHSHMLFVGRNGYTSFHYTERLNADGKTEGYILFNFVRPRDGLNVPVSWWQQVDNSGICYPPSACALELKYMYSASGLHTTREEIDRMHRHYQQLYLQPHPANVRLCRHLVLPKEAGIITWAEHIAAKIGG
ncbi:unnamed protein product [Zymoseptoria tritici ST99CH_1E4]|uniref:Uncharacterized protein n=1 Tax=Zymoseptoria tritici ST99CH_1E4 TaxID=1276532 RepID=A0A2H1G4I0_ZYMTR|nr:unnamed protein product [Zymoseptoria tritici ST99CH_1E4]